MRGEKRGKITCHRRVGRIGKSEFLKAAAARGGFFVEGHAREEPFDDQLTHFVARDFRLQSAQQARARLANIHRDSLRGIVAEQRFLHAPASTDQKIPLPRLELFAGCQSLFEVMRECQVLIVAAKNQVLADGHAMEVDFFGGVAAADADQREIGRAAADVADQNLLTWQDPRRCDSQSSACL